MDRSDDATIVFPSPIDPVVPNATASGGEGAEPSGGGSTSATPLGTGAPVGTGGSDWDTLPMDLADFGERAQTDKLDLLFMVDNSISMADKQETLRRALPALINRLINPICVADDGARVAEPADATAPCPAGSRREFTPILDIHVGVITSSMGDAGANEACAYSDSVPNSDQKVDNGYLLGSLARGGMKDPPFLSWDGTGAGPFTTAFQDQITQAGEFGCGFEASLESWAHFLVDPTPWASIAVVDCAGQSAGSGNCRQPNIPQNADGTLGDPFILAQRKAFLRPDSLVGIVMLTDENDCSIMVGGPFNLIARTTRRMFRSSSVCATDPNDPCCHSCGTQPPVGCISDPVCTADPNLPNDQDEPNLRCFDQKRRFGLDFLYPTDRYVNALTRPELGLCSLDWDPDKCEAPETVANPLFVDQDTGTVRDPSLVFLVGIVGVPWQLLDATVTETGAPYPESELHYSTSFQLGQAEAPGDVTGWDRIMGEPDVRDVHMLEAVAAVETARPGLPDADAGKLADPIHGHEWVSLGSDDLQYACIFPLPTPRDCDGPDFADTQRGCDCRGASDPTWPDANPLCQSADGSYSSSQVAAKAYPSLRHLRVLKDFGVRTNNSVVASICARNMEDPDAQDFGYNPAVGAMVDRFKLNLVGR